MSTVERYLSFYDLVAVKYEDLKDNELRQCANFSEKRSKHSLIVPPFSALRILKFKIDLKLESIPVL